MSTDLRQVLQEGAAGPVEPLNLEGAFKEARLRKIRRRLTGALSAVGIVVAAVFFVAPSLFRQVGLQQVETADDPPASERDEGLGNTGDLTEKGGFAPGSLVTGGAGGGSSKGGSQAGPSQRGVTVAGEKAATPKPAGTYSYDVSGHVCGLGFGGFVACDDVKELDATYDQPIGSHQRVSSRLRYAGRSRSDIEQRHDYRPDGVYWEHYSETYVSPFGTPGEAACPELAVAPIRVWTTGAKPGDHFEGRGSCDDFNLNDSESPYRRTQDIIRAETISIGGREISTLFIRYQQYRDEKRYGYVEAWVLPDQFLFVKTYKEWRVDDGWGEIWTELKSLTPS